MRLTGLELQNFRSHGNFSGQFGKESDTFYFLGDNARGKTNILEAIYLLALTKSFRVQTSTELVRWQDEYARVKGTFEDESGESLELEVFLGNPPQPKKVLKKNGVKISAENFIGNCQIVLFHPEDLNMLYLGPELRRRYLDILNLQVKKNYYRSLSLFKRALEQRNSLLKRVREGLAESSHLDVWDEQLAEHGTFITVERAKAVDFISRNIQEKYREISQKEERLSVIYKNSLEKVSYHELLKFDRKREIEAGITLHGPHRDDLVFSLNGRELEVHASRGEYRSLLLALKLIELDFYGQSTGNRPILLLDDVFSELDDLRKIKLIEAIKGCQTFITATGIDDVVMERFHSGIKIGIGVSDCVFTL